MNSSVPCNAWRNTRSVPSWCLSISSYLLHIIIIIIFISSSYPYLHILMVIHKISASDIWVEQPPVNNSSLSHGTTVTQFHTEQVSILPKRESLISKFIINKLECFHNMCYSVWLTLVDIKINSEFGPYFLQMWRFWVSLIVEMVKNILLKK